MPTNTPPTNAVQFVAFWKWFLIGIVLALIAWLLPDAAWLGWLLSALSGVNPLFALLLLALAILALVVEIAHGRASELARDNFVRYSPRAEAVSLRASGMLFGITSVGLFAGLIFGVAAGIDLVKASGFLVGVFLVLFFWMRNKRNQLAPAAQNSGDRIGRHGN